MIIESDAKIGVRKSQIEGSGTFALTDIMQGELVLVTRGSLMSDHIIDEVVPPDMGETCFQVAKGFHLCPENFDSRNLNGIFLVNHSFEPNCGIKDRTGLIAMRDIRSGEEVTYDYCLTDADYKGLECAPTVAIFCKCKSAKCRKIITGTDWTTIDLQVRYRGYFSDYIMQMINSLIVT